MTAQTQVKVDVEIRDLLQIIAKRNRRSMGKQIAYWVENESGVAKA